VHERLSTLLPFDEKDLLVRTYQLGVDTPLMLSSARARFPEGILPAGPGKELFDAANIPPPLGWHLLPVHIRLGSYLFLGHRHF
jgi:hypothetical protein